MSDLPKHADAFAKAAAEFEKSIRAMKKVGKMGDPSSLPPAVKKEIALLQREIAKLRKDVKAIAVVGKKIGTALGAAHKTAKSKFDAGLAKVSKEYMAAVKKSDGLTSARPATVKALQTAAKARTPKAVDAALASLKDHIADAKKAAGKDKAKLKSYKVFAKTVEGIYKGF